MIPALLARRALLGGIGLGALAAPGLAFGADTKLTALGFGTTPTLFYGEEGGVSKKYSGNSTYNVKDWGAIGDNSHDDTTNIQAAIDAAIVAGGTVVFPAGTYKTTAKLTFTTSSNITIRLVGCGLEAGSIIQANFADYVIDTTASGYPISLIEGLCINNGHVSGKGIKWGSGIAGEVRNCRIAARSLGVYCLAGVALNNCQIVGNDLVGSIGVITYQNQLNYTRVTNWDVGVQMQNVGPTIHGCSFEVNNTALWIGADEMGNPSAVSGGVITSNSFEGNNTAIYAAVCSGMLIAGNTISGTTGVFGETTVTYGMRIANMTGCVVAGLAIAGTFSVKAMHFDQQPHETIFIGVNATSSSSPSWTFPTPNNTDPRFTCLQCNNPTLAMGFTGLPSSPIEGMQYYINDANTATIGNAVTAGGSPNTHGYVVWNGTAWTLMSK